MFLLYHIRNIGNNLCHVKSLAALIKRTIIEKNTIGTKIKFVPEIAFNPALLEITTGIKNNKIKKIRGVLLKYIACKLFEKYLKQMAEKPIKSTTYKKAITYFKILPPKNSETSNISKLRKGLKNLHISNTKIKQMKVMNITLSQLPVPVESTIIVGILIIILLLITVISKAIASTLPIFSILFIY